MSLAITPSSGFPPVSSQQFPNVSNIQAQNNGTNLGSNDFTTLNFSGALRATRSVNTVNVVVVPREVVVTEDAFGADPTGSTNVVSAFTSMLASPVGIQIVPAGTYKFDTSFTPAARDLTMLVDPKAVFTGAGTLNFNNQIPFQHPNTWVQNLMRKTFDSAWDDYWDAFLLGGMVVATGTSRAVALYGRGNASANGSRAWGGNVVGAVDVDGGIAIALEVDCQIVGAGNTTAQSYGVVIAASGDLPSRNAIQIQASNANSPFTDGIFFNFRAGNIGFVSNLVKIEGDGDGLSTCARFLYATQARATGAEIDFPSFVVGATPVAAVNRLKVSGGATGDDVSFESSSTVDTNVNIIYAAKGTGIQQFRSGGTGGSNEFRVGNGNGTEYVEARSGIGAGVLIARGTATNCDVIVIGKGTGGSRLRDGASNDKIQVNTTGIGFNGSPPIAKPATAAVSTDLATVITLANNLKTILTNYGLTS